MYQVLEISLADVNRLYGYFQQEAFRVKFSLKGFDYPWILASHPWKKKERVLDVGAAYSPLPLHIQETFGCEVWAVDDFGVSSDEPFWKRNASPQEYIASHPEVNYVLERLGDPGSSTLPAGHFNVVYSLSTLEHVPPAVMPQVFRHMDLLLKPGGEMVHAVDMQFPSNGGARKLLMALVFDALLPLLPSRLVQAKCLATPRAFLRLLFRTLQIRCNAGRELSVLNMVLNPNILTESYHYGIKRIQREGMKDFRYQRVGSLLIRLKKVA